MGSPIARAGLVHALGKLGPEAQMFLDTRPGQVDQLRREPHLAGLSGSQCVPIPDEERAGWPDIPVSLLRTTSHGASPGLLPRVRSRR
jgi:hypothetical protein